MSQPDLKNEINAAEVEPLLPIEKKLIGWSLGLGIVLLVDPDRRQSFRADQALALTRICRRTAGLEGWPGGLLCCRA